MECRAVFSSLLRDSNLGRPAMPPTFLCLGGQRCGTTWLYEALKICPFVQVSVHKETDFFNRKIFFENLADYERYFDDAKSKPAATAWGEVSPNYCMLKRPGIELIHKLYPQLRLVLILRNPVERSLSQAWLDLCFMRHQPERRISTFEYLLHVERQRTQRRNDYVRILQDWQAVFGAEALHIGLYDDLVADPRGFFRTVLRHLRVDDWPLPEQLVNQRVFASGLPQPSAFIRWYYARTYRPQVVELNERLQGRVTAWLAQTDALLADERPWWNWLRGVNKYALSVPEKLAYGAYDWWRDQRYQARANAILRQRDEQSAARSVAPGHTVLVQS
jgi:Sulfotransferase family